MANELDQTIRLRPARQQAVGAAAWTRSRTRLWLAGLGAAAGLAGLAAMVLLGSPGPRPAPSVAPQAEAPVAAPRIVATPLLDEDAIQALQPAQPGMVRLRSNPRVFVLLFTDLEQQGSALNRVAALVEKRGLPRDRLLNDLELAAAITASGDTPATWYFGHDYRASDLERFFSLAERDRVRLNEAELWVRDRLREARMQTTPGEPLALVSTANAGPLMDAATRAAILKHELAHGHYFTLPGFANHVHMVWQSRFTAADRAAFTDLLGREGYDPGNAELLANEAMAYLLFTPDRRIFNAGMLGVPEAELDRLRALMRSGLPLP